MKKRIPYSTVNYEKLVTEEYYMVDKSRFIAELEQYEIPLFLRPRRFGKSMFCSMLEHYYDIRFASRFDELFGHTDIGRHPTRKHNQYTVLMMDFSGMTTTTADLATLEFRFCQKISNAFWHFFDKHDLPCPDFIPPPPPASFTEPPPSTKINMPTASEMLANLIRHVKALRLPPLYVIIDEYDNFANHLILAHQDDIYTSATGKDSFLKSFFATLKNATQCGQVANCFLTGILPITVNDLNSGFSIACNVTLMPALHDMLGFTKDETHQYVSQIFADYGYPVSRLETALDQMQNFYDGYIFRPDAKHHLFNSSISNYYLFSLLAEEGTLPTDPVDVNQSLDMGWIVRLAGTSQSALAFVQRLLQGEPLPFNRSDLSLQFNLGQFLTPEFLPAALFFLGQLTWVGDGLLGFPNFTIRTQFLQLFQSMSKLAIPQDNIRELFLQYQQDGDLATLATRFWKAYFGTLPAQMFDHANESFYALPFTFYCQKMLSRAEPMAESNLATGRCDLWMKTPAGQLTLIEFKRIKARAKLPSAPLKADRAQALAYADELGKRHHRPVNAYLFYLQANHDCRFFPL